MFIGHEHGRGAKRSISVDMALQKAIQETFMALGCNTAYALIRILSKKGVPFTSGKIDLAVLHEGLKTILGAGADLIMQMIFDELCENFHCKDNAKLANIGMMSAVDKIHALLVRLEEGEEEVQDRA